MPTHAPVPVSRGTPHHVGRGRGNVRCRAFGLSRMRPLAHYGQGDLLPPELSLKKDPFRDTPPYRRLEHGPLRCPWHGDGEIDLFTGTWAKPGQHWRALSR